MATKAAETAVRQYLLYVEDPAQLRDEKDIQAKTKAVLEAKDPIDRLKAIAALEAAANVDEKPLREGFVTHAKAWGDEVGVPWKAFTELKVPWDVLREAGFDVPTNGRSETKRGGGGARLRAPAVPVEEIAKYVLKIKGTFVLADVIGGVGGSQATVRKALDELIAGEQVQKLGTVPNYAGRGRAPLEYKVT